MTMANVFNHPNFGSAFPGIDPLIIDAGLKQEGVGFGTPYLESGGQTPIATGDIVGGTRTIFFGLKIIF
jgi:hypothetical protein